MPDIKGGCLCGKVRYAANAEPVFVGLCHCKDCQRWTGAAFATVIGLPAPSVTVEGTVRTFTGTADSGKTTYRKFCADCGSSVLDEAEALPGVVMIAAGTLDDASWVKPAMQIFCDSAQPWVSLGGDIKAFPKMPG